MKKLNKKIILIIGLIIIIIVGIIIYVKPMTLSDITMDNSTLIFSKIDLGVKDGQPYHESVEYSDITDEQRDDILLLLNNYPYVRNIKTLFSDGSMSDNDGDGYFYIFIYDEMDYKGSIIVAYDDEISVNNKNYTMNNSSDFINQILDILNQ